MTTLFKQTLSALFFLSLLPATAALADDEEECLNLWLSEKQQDAIPICEQAAERGNAVAQLALGSMYLGGEGVAQDHQEAYIWISLAANQEHSDAKAILSIVELMLTPEQINAAQEEAARRAAAYQ